MYNKAKLVHGDLSEYNILYYKNKIYFIDVSQSVEHDHMNALGILQF
jgi:RIO kinase 1